MLKRRSSKKDGEGPQEALYDEEKAEVVQTTVIDEKRPFIRKYGGYISLLLFLAYFLIQNVSLPIKITVETQDFSDIVKAEDIKALCENGCTYRNAEKNSVRRIDVVIHSINENLICRMDTNDVVISLQNELSLKDALFLVGVGVNNLPQRNEGCKNLSELAAETFSQDSIQLAEGLIPTIEARTKRAENWRKVIDNWKIILIGFLIATSLITYKVYTWRKNKVKKAEEKESDDVAAAKTRSEERKKVKG